MNFQNIPRDLLVVKRAIIPKRGALSEFDYSQIEPRFFAYFAATALKDPTIADWYREGRDVYLEIAAKAYGKPTEEITKEERQEGKVWFLMSLYGAGPKKVAAEIGMPLAEAKAFYKAFHAGLPQIKGLSNPPPKNARYEWTPGAVERIYRRRGYLKTHHGMHLHAEQYGEHKLLNKLIQGSAALLMKAAIVRVHKWLRAGEALVWEEAREDIGLWVTQDEYERLREVDVVPAARPLESRMVLTVHDSIMFDGPEHEVPILHEAVPPLMREDWLHEVVPIEIDHDVTTTNWAEKVPYEEWVASRQEVIAG